MKQKGDNWKKFENLEKQILTILSKKEISVSEVKSKLKIKVSWITVQNYLISLYDKKKIKKKVLGRYTFWYKE